MRLTNQVIFSTCQPQPGFEARPSADSTTGNDIRVHFLDVLNIVHLGHTVTPPDHPQRLRLSPFRYRVVPLCATDKLSAEHYPNTFVFERTAGRKPHPLHKASNRALDIKHQGHRSSVIDSPTTCLPVLFPHRYRHRQSPNPVRIHSLQARCRAADGNGIMNPAPGQGLAGRANAQNPQAAQAAAAPNRQQGPPLYRPEMMRSITFLAEDEKVKYEKGLAGLWKLHDSAAPGSPQQDETKKKIAEFGRMLLNKIHQRRQQVQQQQQAQPQPGQPQQPQRPPLQQSIQQGLQQSGQVGVPPHVQQATAAQGGAGPSANMGNPPSQTPATGVHASPNLAAAAAQARSLPGHIVAHLNDMQFQPPPNVPDKAKWLEEIKQKYSRALFLMESARSTTKTIDQTLQDNQSLPPEERKKLEDRKAQLQKQYTEAISFANLVRKQYVTGGNQRPAQNGAAAAPNAANQARPQTSGAQGVAQPCLLYTSPSPRD